MVNAQRLQFISEECPVVVIEYEKLLSDNNLSEEISTAFGHDGLGIIAVRHVPGFVEQRAKTLPLMWEFAQLSNETKKKYEVPPYYQRGWDIGHEMMKEGVPDFSKGSFYINPVKDKFEGVSAQDAKDFPTFFGENIFPTEIPLFESSLKTACSMMIEVGKNVARHCDLYVHSKIPEYPGNKIEKIITESQHHAARFLHYFPAEKTTTSGNIDEEDNWCGWHNDHCSLTGLMPGMFHQKDGTPIPNPDKYAGLYIKARSGKVIHAKVPSDVLLFQIGETAQIHTGGLLKATPHMVRGAKVADISRSTLAVFMEPNHKYEMNLPGGNMSIQETVDCPHLPPSVPSLAERWNNEGEDTFGEFSRRTFDAYYQQKICTK